jgi:hypothetical protein
MKNLAVAYAVRKQAMKKKMSDEGMPKVQADLHDDMKGSLGSDIVKAVLKKRMAMGGMVEDESDGDDFLTAEMPPVDMGDETYPDPDDTEHEIDEDPAMKKKKMISSIMQGLHMKHMGK